MRFNSAKSGKTRFIPVPNVKSPMTYDFLIIQKNQV